MKSNESIIADFSPCECSVSGAAPGAFRYALKNLGCKSNRYEADALMAFFEAQGGREAAEGEPVDIALVNTCTVTGEAGRKSRQTLRRCRREHPEAIVAVMGCHSELEDMSALADLSTGTSGRLELGQACLELLKARRQGSPAPHFTAPRDQDYEELGIVRTQSETRAQIKICDGCAMRCSYCAICHARGHVRSRSRDAILEEARALLEAGHRELVLTATHLCSFELDKGRDSLALVELLEELDRLPGLLNLRLGSLEPASITPAFIQRAARLKSLVPHFHLSLQSGSDTVLRRMNRRYNSAQYREIVQNLRAAFDEPFFSTDMMVAFPEETEEEFAESLRFAEEIGFARIHVFRYSVREHTPAAGRPQVADEISKARGEALQKLADRLAAEAAASRLGRPGRVILEQPLPGDAVPYRYTATTRRYLPALVRPAEGLCLKKGGAYEGRIEKAEGERVFLCAEREL